VRDADYATLLDENDNPVDDVWLSNRRAELLRVFERARPETLLVESFPFARRMFAFELLPVLSRARSSEYCKIVLCSIRDILEPKLKAGRNEEAIERLARWFDGVLMHCDQRLTSLEDSFPLGREINNRVHYTGYVIEQTSIDIGARDCAGEVLVSAGGGAAGTALLRTAVKARNLLPDNAPRWRCLVGPNLAEATFQELKRHEYAGLVIERNRSDFPILLARAQLSISQAGYNTVFEALAARYRLVLVPFCVPGEPKQSLRSALLEERGLC
jgi:predicted glycosyltransferase